MLVHGVVQLPQHHSLYRLSCPHGTFSPPLTAQVWLFSGLSVLLLGSMWMSCVPIPCCLDDVRFVV